MNVRASGASVSTLPSSSWFVLGEKFARLFYNDAARARQAPFAAEPSCVTLSAGGCRAMTVITCEKCGAKNRVDERVTIVGKEPVCGRCGARLPSGGASYASGDAASGGAGAMHSGGAREDESKPKTVTDATFKRDVIEAFNTRPVLLDCWAEWCPPCRALAPTLDALAAESAGLYRIAKLNVDENPR